MFKKFFFGVFINTIIMLAAYADVNDTTISVNAGSDEQNNTNSMVSVDMGLRNDKRLFFGFGKSKTPSGSNVIVNNTSFVGISKNHNENWKMTGMLEYSGLKGAFSIFSTSAAFRFNQNSFYIEAIPAFRSIKLTTLSNKNVFISGTALGLKSGVFIGKHFRLSGSAYSYNYSKDVSLLASFASTRYFNNKTLLLSSGLLEKSYNLETGLDYDSLSVSLGKNRSISAIDDSSSDYVYSALDYYISDAWGLSLMLGEYLDTPSDQNNFSSVTVNYTF